MIPSDRLSPILVKELRQGIRSNLFTGAFLLIQTLLFFFGLSLVSSESMRQDPSAGTAIFWATLAIPLLLLVPGTASQMVEKEVTGKTLELLLLTRLSSYRIVLGKWMSAVAQSALILSSVLPYLMLRYFLGGIDIWVELKAFVSLLLASAVLAGIAMGFWAVNVSRWAKVGALLVGLWLVPWVFALMFMPHGGIPGLSGLGTIGWIYSGIIMLMMMDSAAARIGPPAENHTTRVRLLALGALLLAFPLSFANESIATTMSLFVVLPTIVASLNESVRPVARLYEPFTRGSVLRRMATAPFCPGWPGGLAFAAIVALLIPLLPALADDMSLFLWLSIVGTFALPAALMHTVFSGVRRKAPYYMLLLAVSTIPVYVYAFAEGLSVGSLASTLRTIGGLVPPLAAALEIQSPDGYDGVMLVRFALTVVTGVSVYALAQVSRRERRRIAEMSRRAKSSAPLEALTLETSAT